MVIQAVRIWGGWKLTRHEMVWVLSIDLSTMADSNHENPQHFVPDFIENSVGTYPNAPDIGAIAELLTSGWAGVVAQ